MSPKLPPDDFRERLKARRKEAARARKAQIAADPRVIALKEKAKEKRRAAYAAAKAKRKAIAEEKKRNQRDAKDARTRSAQARRDDALRALVHPASTPTPDEEPNR
jgi:hypothetical protein